MTPLFGPSDNMSPITRQILAQALASNNAPVSSPLQGAARMGNKWAEALLAKKLETKDKEKQTQAARVMGEALKRYSGSPAGLDPSTGIKWNSPRPPDQSGALAQLLSNEQTAPYGVQLQFGDIEAQRSLQNDITKAKALQPLELELAMAKARIDRDYAAPPASIALANEIQKAREAGDIQRVNDLLLSGKSLEKGMSLDADGNIVTMRGFTDSTGDISYAKQSGQNISDMEYKPKIAEESALRTELGKDKAIKQIELNERLSQYPRLEQVVNELSVLGKDATYTGAGRTEDVIQRELGLNPGPDAVARTEYISKVDNEILPLLRQTFGAQFTEREGQSLKVTLGDPNKSPAEKDAVLRSFIATKQAQIQSLQRQVGSDDIGISNMNQQDVERAIGATGQEAPSESKVLNGKTYTKIGGQWYETGN